MSDDNSYNDDLERYFNDPEYRKNLKNKKGKERSQESADSKDPENEKAGNTSKNIKNSKTSKNPKVYTQYSDSFFSLKNKPPFPWKVLGKWVSILLAVCIIFGTGFFIYLYQGLPSIQQLENPKVDIASVVKTRDGVVLDKYFTQNRTYVPLSQISPNVIHALIATEDHRFYHHWGIDMFRTLAIPYHIMMGNPQGGSTITQQLARNLYKKIGRQFSITRKLREMITAVEIERHYTKREILEMYLNTVEFPNSSFGIQTAAETHFGKSAKDLNVLEAATLIGSLQAVYAYNPRLRPLRSQQRRNTVLYQMAKRGFITQQQRHVLDKEPIVLNYHPPFKTGKKSRYFGEYVRQKVQKWCKKNGYNLYRDGLTIYTTIDSRMQKYAEKALGEKLDSIQTIFENEWTSPGGTYMDKYWKKYPAFLNSYIEETDAYKNGFAGHKTRIQVLDSLKADSAFIDSVKHAYTHLEAGFVAENPTNGHLLAWVGGSNYANEQYDHVYQAKRQVGSTFKPFVYAVAIDNGYPPYQKFSKYPTKYYSRNGTIWSPHDFETPIGPDMVTLSDALARSMNNVTVRLLPELAGNPGTNRLEDLQPAVTKIIKMAHRLGIHSKLKHVPSIALGTSEVSLLEMVGAYSTFANYGVHIEPLAITRIVDKEGNVLKQYHPDYEKEAISPSTAYTMIDMLRGVVRGVDIGDGRNLGTGIRLRIVYHVHQDIAAKTGTTQNSADNWFIAMTPHVVMGAWVGGDDRRIRFPKNTYIGQGARTALPIVGDFIDKCMKDPNVHWSYDAFQQPKGYVPPEPPKQNASNPLKGKKKGKIGW
ncbi:MAG TPA: transglycosylase domain-containing protein [Balneolales bacterium]|nr:transglycosylase domain-containing protein [Balneolales bacterium]